MKKIIIIVLFLCILQVVYCETEAVQPQNFNESSAGTEENPFIIENLANLRWLSETSAVWGDSLTTFYFIQVANIDAAETISWNNGEGFYTIGITFTGEFPDYVRFYANYDGQGHCINNLSINNPTNANRSLFGNIQNSSIRNLNLVNISYYGTSSGMIAMAIDSEIVNCSVSGNISEGVGNHAGFIGNAYSSYISRCFSNVIITITEPNYVVSAAGFSSGIHNSQLDNCYSMGNLTIVNADYPGCYSFMAEIVQSTVNNCYSTVGVNCIISSILSGYMSESVVNNFFWDNELVNTINVNNMVENSDLVNVIGFSTEQMKDSANYIEYGWDFENIWSINPEINDGYPFLQWELNSTPNSELDNSATPVEISATNYPNPFNPETTIEFNNPVRGEISVNIYNLKGQLVKKLLQDNLTQGVHKVVWNGTDDNNKGVSSGVYFYKISNNNNNLITKRTILMK